MFMLSPFNQDISGWNLSGYTDLTQMFSGCVDFNELWMER